MAPSRKLRSFLETERRARIKKKKKKRKKEEETN
jgi:hypothetical protein